MHSRICSGGYSGEPEVELVMDAEGSHPIRGARPVPLGREANGELTVIRGAGKCMHGLAARAPFSPPPAFMPAPGRKAGKPATVQSNERRSRVATMAGRVGGKEWKGMAGGEDSRSVGSTTKAEWTWTAAPRQCVHPHIQAFSS